MKIALGADHAGYELKDKIRQHLQQRGIQVQDEGTRSDESVDYPDYACLVAHDVSQRRAILICGSGIGMAMAANKVAGIRAAHVSSEHEARMSREHNNANVLALGARVLKEEEALRIVDQWLATPFAGGRHERRVEKIAAMEKEEALSPAPAARKALMHSMNCTRTRGDFEISTDPRRIDVAVVHQFLTSSYWAKGIPVETVQRSLQNSLCFGLYHAEQQVGFARVITDRATFAYLADVFVLPAFRGRGLSKWLMECIFAHEELQGLRRWSLATRDAHKLYQQFGFRALAAPDLWKEKHDPEIYAKETGPERSLG
jgi:RpiB/LacA/LacB family sugar-phosphate isomerase